MDGTEGGRSSQAQTTTYRSLFCLEELPKIERKIFVFAAKDYKPFVMIFNVWPLVCTNNSLEERSHAAHLLSFRERGASNLKLCLFPLQSFHFKNCFLQLLTALAHVLCLLKIAAEAISKLFSFVSYSKYGLFVTSTCPALSTSESHSHAKIHRPSLPSQAQSICSSRRLHPTTRDPSPTPSPSQSQLPPPHHYPRNIPYSSASTETISQLVTLVTTPTGPPP